VDQHSLPILLLPICTAGVDRFGCQIYRCKACGRRQTERSTSAFRSYQFPDDIIALAVRWYLRFRLPSADVAELFAERCSHVDPSTIYDWVQHVAPLYREVAGPHRHRGSRQAGLPGICRNVARR
jgi:hypothetical protein